MGRWLRMGRRRLPWGVQACLACLACLAGLAPAAGSAAAVRVVDDLGTDVVLERPAGRIVCLYGGLTEIVCALGLDGALVGCTRGETYPPSVRAKPRVGTHLRPNLELILGLAPDLVLQGGGRAEAAVTVARLRARGIPAAVFNPADFEGLFSTIRRIGVLTGRPAAARRLVADMERRLQAVRALVPRGAPRPKVFFEVNETSLIAAGARSIVDAVIEQAGGRNVVRVPKRLVRCDLEFLLAAAPDVYVIQEGVMNPAPSDPRRRPNFALLPAVRAGRILRVDEALFSRPGPRSVQAVELLHAFLYPRAAEVAP